MRLATRVERAALLSFIGGDHQLFEGAGASLQGLEALAFVEREFCAGFSMAGLTGLFGGVGLVFPLQPLFFQRRRLLPPGFRHFFLPSGCLGLPALFLFPIEVVHGSSSPVKYGLHL